MVESFKSMQPKDTFELKHSGLLSQEDNRVLNLLYQPIIGSKAYTLFLNLLMNHHEFAKTNNHFALMDLMNEGGPSLYESRIRLEAIGLLKTYVRKIDTGYHYIYIIQPVLPAHAFLSDDVLSILLLDRVGEARFNRLVNMFSIDHGHLNDFTDISKNYVDVFHIRSEAFVTEEPLLNHVKEQVEIPEANVPQIDNVAFDWEFFMDNLSAYHLNQAFLKDNLKEIVLMYHSLYGIDELEMSNLVKRHIDHVTDQIDIKSFKQQVYSQYHQANRTKHNKPKATLEQVSQHQVKNYEKQLRSQGLSQNEITLIITCEQNPPLVFLKALKEQKGGFVAGNERWAIENLKKNSNLSNSVINVLIHYLLVVLKHDSINQNLLNTVANNWAQNKVTTAVEALAQAKAFKEEKQKPKQNQSYKKSYQAPVRKETLPDWAKEEGRRKETPLSKEEQAKIDEQLRLLNEGGGL